ncbi:putative methyltransferase DDB_G0268948 isoform X1 [Acanthopagrus latus]|uniref:putative methyltransferase DDB_G0268948 isoform X1 n=1 Tax=Acanthopagrus latus TaxID=8177 RepID=UPI00187CDEE8|nr:putative methyltransferase DDB_G0268948 isoform X1 [Acanthopagrus latus]
MDFKITLSEGLSSVLRVLLLSKVVGTDVSTAQLEMVRTISNPPNVSYRRCPAEDLPFASGEVDLVTAMTAAHWFDRKKFLLEADRVLRPGGCLALLNCSPLMIKLKYGDVSNTLSDICQEFYDALSPFFSPHLGLSLTRNRVKIYKDIYNSCSYLEKEWHECFPVERIVPLTGYTGIVKTSHCYMRLLEADAAEAERLFNELQYRLLSAMRTSSPDTEVTMIFPCHYLLAHKPL